MNRIMTDVREARRARSAASVGRPDDSPLPWLPESRAARLRIVALWATTISVLTVIVHLVLAHGGARIGGVELSHSMIDLGVYRAGVRAFLQGRDPYGPGLGAPADLPYTYTPFSTIALMPVGWFSRGVSEVLSSIVSVVALLVSLLVVLRALFGRLARPETWWTAAALLAVVVAASEPMRETLAFGQVNLVLMTLVLLDVLLLRNTRFAGVLIGIASGIKLIPLMYVLYLFASRRFRAGLVACASAVGTVAVGWVLMPGPSTTYFFHLMFDAERVGGVGYVGDQSLNGLLTRLVTQDVAPKSWWMASAAAVTVLGIWVATRVHRTVGEPAGIAVAALTALLASPISWSHHWVWWVVATLVMVHRAWVRRSRGWAIAAVLWTVPFYVAPFWIIAHPSRAAVQASFWRQLAGDTYVVLGLLALAALAMLLWRRPRAAAAMG